MPKAQPILRYSCSAFDLLLQPELVRSAALLLSAVGGAQGETSVALSAHLGVTIVRAGEGSQGGFNHTTAKAQNQVQGRLLLNVVVAEGASVCMFFDSSTVSLIG